ncbi:MAG: outer membrane protein assembly factor BamD, partial [Candidatus Aminicenantes bacterium]|nr:outer membrane protein assembly factor BamD [Candidatus Aminicenantes bacterium]
MNILKRFLFVSLAGLLITSLGLTAGVPDKSAWGSGLTGLESNYENIKFADEELDVFLKAKDYVFKRYWRKAKEQLEFYLKKYPSGQLRAEALYWLAQSLNRISKDEVDKDKVIALKEEAVQKLELLIGQYPESVWTDDAQELRVEIAGELALIGRTEYK